MSYFQISPGAHKKSKLKIQKNHNEEDTKIEVLNLAPFTPIPKIAFSDVIVGTSHKRELLIKNPTNVAVKLCIIHHIPRELNLFLNWNNVLIEKGCEEKLEITWEPLKEEACRYILTFADGKKIKRDIAISLKSILPKGSKKVKAKSTSLKLASKCKSPPNRLTNQENRLLSKTGQYKSPGKIYPQNGKSSNSNSNYGPWRTELKENNENILPNSDTSFLSVSSPSFLASEIETVGRFTYIKEPLKEASANFHNPLLIEPRESLVNYSDSLESEKSTPNTPSLESLLRQTREKPKMPQNLIDNSSILGYSDIFNPEICSSVSKPPSQENSLKSDGSFSSPRTYIKLDSPLLPPNSDGNISGGTYTKESSHNITPIISSTRLNFEDPSLPLKRISLSPVNPMEKCTRYLSTIAEENWNSEINITTIRSKRKIPLSSGTPAKKIAKNDWSKFETNPVRSSKRSSGLNLMKFLGENDDTLRFTETITRSTTVRNPLVYFNEHLFSLNSSTVISDEFFEEHQKNFTKWLNAILTPPNELESHIEVDIAKIWQAIKKTDVPEALSRDTLSFRYNTNSKLDALREQAKNLFQSKEIQNTSQKVCAAIEGGKLSIREDKDIHLNLQLKSDIILLLLGYNPLWLRIGLETIYNEIIPLKSNSDTQGLAYFLLNRFLKEPQLVKKYRTVYTPKYSFDLKKMLLKKFFVLVFFLDRAKNEKLIQHDPCLFCKNAPEKESKLILTHFARETLSGVGDIIKYLKNFGYTINHVQTYIHEFDYAVTNLGIDLRDGVRLAKVMEIIQLRDDLTKNLRVPAISRLQKIHNMEVIFKSLEERGFKVLYDIVAKDIVEGHREKTLSFLWQIIYKFETPLMIKSASRIQTWFRSLQIQLKRKKLFRERLIRENAANKIQKWYKQIKLYHTYKSLLEFVNNYIEERKLTKAAITIQSFYRMKVLRTKYLHLKYITLKLQTYGRGWLIRHNYLEYLAQRNAAVKIQSFYKMYVKRREYRKMQQSILVVQRRYRAIEAMKFEQSHYILLKNTTVFIQRKFRAQKEMIKCRQQYLAQKNAAIKIQTYYRMYVVRRKYMELCKMCVIIQRKLRANIAMKTQRKLYVNLKMSAITIQRRFRANAAMKMCRQKFLTQRRAAIKIQSCYKMYAARKRFVALRTISVHIQRQFRANIAMKTQRIFYIELKNSAVIIQRRFRANVAMKICRQEFLIQKNAAIKIQSNFRMYAARKRFTELRTISINIQRQFRANIAMKTQRKLYSSMKKSAVTIQRRFRANVAMKICRQKFLTQRNTIIKIQSFYRMYVLKKRYQELRKNVIAVQRKFRANNEMKAQKLIYASLKKATVFIQRRYRANKEMKKYRNEFLKKKAAAIKIQSIYKMHVVHNQYLELRKSVMRIQIRFRANRAMKLQRTYYVSLKIATLTIQRRFKANKEMELCRRNFVIKKQACIKIQSFYKMYVIRKRFIELRKSTIFIQSSFRTIKLMKFDRNNYNNLKKATIIIQQRYRATIQAKLIRSNFLLLKQSAINIQLRFRANIAMKRERYNFTILKKYTILMQQRFRAKLLGRKCRIVYFQIKEACLVIQQRLRAKNSAIQCYKNYSKLKSAVLVVQAQFRAQRSMKIEMAKYQCKKNAAIVIQRRYRAAILYKTARKQYTNLLLSVKIIQTHYRAYIEMKKFRQRYLEICKAGVILQKYTRGYLIRKKYGPLLTPEAIEARKLLKLQEKAAVKIQAYWRGHTVRNSNNSVMIALRNRTKIKSTPNNNQSQTLAQKCENAMGFMLSGASSLNIIIKALEDLDFVTMHCPELCNHLSHILPMHLYVIITSAARSVPEMKALNNASLILINFYKCEITRERSFGAEHLDGLIDVLVNWCDKDEPLFCTLCTLFWLFAHENHWKRVIRNLPNLNRRLTKMVTNVERKQNMVLKSKQVRNFKHFGNDPHEKCPRRNASWGLMHLNSPNTFSFAPFAISQLMKILS